MMNFQNFEISVYQFYNDFIALNFDKALKSIQVAFSNK